MYYHYRLLPARTLKPMLTNTLSLGHNLDKLLKHYCSASLLKLPSFSAWKNARSTSIICLPTSLPSSTDFRTSAFDRFLPLPIEICVPSGIDCILAITNLVKSLELAGMLYEVHFY